MDQRKISLAVIAGNVADILPRFLDHFQSIADEVIIVQAIGNAEPDDTLAIAKERGCITEYYHNADNHCKWLHIDNFADARNQAWSLARGEWIMWADTDDIIDVDHAAALRRLLQGLDPAEVDMVSLPYSIPGQGIMLERERIAARGFAEWTSPVHETLVPVDRDAEVRLVKVTDIHIVHAADNDRPTSNERNLTILRSIPQEQMTTSLRYHLAQELRGLRRNDEAREAIHAFLADPEGGPVERYECWINLAQMVTDPAQVAECLTSALVEDPTRAEALVELTQLHAAMGNSEKALGYARMVKHLPVPRPAPWTLRRALYNHVRVATHAQALRSAGRFEEADQREQNSVIDHGAHISLLHASRGRPEQALHCMRNWLSLADDPASIEHIFALDADDPATVQALRIYRHIVLPPGGGCVAAWNAAAQSSVGGILIQLSDDWTPPRGWDRLIRAKLPDPHKSAVLQIHDGHRHDDLLCMAILTRQRYLDQGYLFHPEFTGVFSDNHFTDQAKSDGVIIDARQDITITHRHPVFDKTLPMDATYRRQNSLPAYARGAGIYKRLKSGILTSSDIDGWFDFRDLYDHFAQLLSTGDHFAEVGVWKGKSFIHLAQHLDDLNKKVNLHAIDHFLGDVHTGHSTVRGIFDKHMEAAHLTPNLTQQSIHVHQCHSQAAGKHYDDEQFDIVFIDAAHDRMNCSLDIAAWLPKLKPGGIMAGHDYDAPGVQQAVSDHLPAAQPTSMRCWIYQKPTNSPLLTAN